MSYCRITKSLPLFIFPAILLFREVYLNECIPADHEISNMEQTREYRSIAIVGRKGVGKATIANKIVGIKAFPQDSPKVVVNESGSCEYVIQLIEINNSSDQVMDMLEDRLKGPGSRASNISTNYPGLNLLIFVCKEIAFTKKEKETFNNVYNNLSVEMKKKSCIIITHCEEIAIGNRKAYLEDFRKEHDLVIPQIYTVGFPDLKAKKADYREKYRRGIENDESTIRHLVNGMSQIVLPVAVFVKPTYNRTMTEPMIELTVGSRRRRCCKWLDELLNYFTLE